MDFRSVQSAFPHLTERETTVVLAVANGRGNAEIASDLGIAEKTVKNALLSIPSKMGLSDDRGGSLRVRIALRAHGIPFGA